MTESKEYVALTLRVTAYEDSIIKSCANLEEALEAEDLASAEAACDVNRDLLQQLDQIFLELRKLPDLKVDDLKSVVAKECSIKNQTFKALRRVESLKLKLNGKPSLPEAPIPSKPSVKLESLVLAPFDGDYEFSRILEHF